MSIIRGVPARLVDFLRGRFKVSLYAKGTDEGDTSLVVNPDGQLIVGVNGITVPSDGLGNDAVQFKTKDGQTESRVCVLPCMFNGSTWDRMRNNEEFTVLPSATRNSTTSSSVQYNYNARAMYLMFHISSVPGVDTVTLYLQFYDPVAGGVTIFSDIAVSSTQYRKIFISPEGDGSNSNANVYVRVPVPRRWYVTIAHSGTGDFVYSLAGCYIL